MKTVYVIVMALCFILIFTLFGAMTNTYFDDVSVEVLHHHEVETPWVEFKNGFKGRQDNF